MQETPHFMKKDLRVPADFPQFVSANPKVCDIIFKLSHLYAQVNHGPQGSKPALGHHDPLRAALCFLANLGRSDAATWRNRFRRSHGWPQAIHTVDIVQQRQQKQIVYQL